jgi:hypothetical protein
MAVRLAPGVGDDPATVLVLRKAFQHAIAVMVGDDIGPKRRRRCRGLRGIVVGGGHEQPGEERRNNPGQHRMLELENRHQVSAPKARKALTSLYACAVKDSLNGPKSAMFALRRLDAGGPLAHGPEHDAPDPFLPSRPDYYQLAEKLAGAVTSFLDILRRPGPQGP